MTDNCFVLSDDKTKNEEVKPVLAQQPPTLGVVVDGLLLFADAVRYRFHSFDEVIIIRVVLFRCCIARSQRR
jgi:hypothetical protein